MKANRQQQIVSSRCTLWTLFAIVLLVLTSCRGYLTEKRPIHLNPNMDIQSKYLSQKLPLEKPEGVVAWGAKVNATEVEKAKFLKENIPFYYGRVSLNGALVRRIPIEVDAQLMQRGRERYNIYCAACHDRSGSGQSMVVKRGMVQPVNLVDPRLQSASDGEIFNIITGGRRNMPAYGKRISETDRWAIVAYVRALQIAQTTDFRNLSQKERKQLLLESDANTKQKEASKINSPSTNEPSTN